MIKVARSNANLWEKQPMTTSVEPIVPVWLNLDDLELIERCLNDAMSTHELGPELERDVARLVKHFDSVRCEFLAHQS
jgi:hypothetical protein